MENTEMDISSLWKYSSIGIELLASSPYVSFEDNDRRDIENVIRTLSQAEQVGLL